MRQAREMSVNTRISHRNGSIFASWGSDGQFYVKGQESVSERLKNELDKNPMWKIMVPEPDNGQGGGNSSGQRQ